MAIASGTKLGSYEILGPLGAGGMGEVYRARDTRLNRMVAIKVLPEKFASDEGRMLRFGREAKLLAALNHPHIAAIHGVEESSSSLYLILELAEGVTLADRLARGPFPLEEALAVALQVSEALEAAHEKGIVHRDLKPANIKIDAAGQIKLLDFGLAKAWLDSAQVSSHDASLSPTISRVETGDGMILGTAAYMSPEQARGKSVDRRADIWAFGALLYELLTGRRLFHGETISDVLAAILKTDPDLDALPAETPAGIRGMIKRCLERDPRRRLQHIGEARIIIEDALAHPEQTVVSRKTARSELLPWAVVGVLLLLFTAAAIRLSLHRNRNAASPDDLSVFAVSLAPDESLLPDENPIIAISADGRSLAYTAYKDKARRLFIRRMDRMDPVPVEGAEDAFNPFFSPDGRWIGFFSNGKLQKIQVSGGTPVDLADAPSPRGACWTPDGHIVFSPGFATGLMMVSASGGKPEPLTMPDLSKNERTHRWPEILPDGKAVLFSIGWLDSPSNYDNGDIAIVSLDTKRRKTLIHDARMAKFLDPGCILFQRTTTLFVAGFNKNTLELTSSPLQVQEHVAGEASSGAGYFATAHNGTLISVPTSSLTSDAKLVLFDRNGNGTPLPLPAGSYDSPRFSPDGKQVAFASGRNAANSDIWTYDLGSGSMNRLTFDTHSLQPLWSLDGKKIVYTSAAGKEDGLAWKAADGSGSEQHLVTIHGPAEAGAWSADGNTLLYTVVGKADDIAQLDVRSPGTSKPFLNTNDVECCPTLSPDGHWIAYVSSENGKLQVFVTSFPEATGKWQISTDVGYNPLWSRTGNEIIFESRNKMMTVPVETKPTFKAGAPRVLFEGSSFIGMPPKNNADLSPDGKKIVIVQSSENLFVPKQINVYLHFADWVAKLVPPAPP